MALLRTGKAWPRVGDRRVAAVAVSVLLLGALVFLRIYDAGTWHLQFPCLFHRLTGLYCPGCGSGRAMTALLHGRVVEAFGYNALATTLIPALFAEFCLYVRSCLSTNAVGVPSISPALTRILLVAILVFSIARNISVPPLSWLAP